jgi:membrane protease YdiL (CAAX protease family)
MRKVRPMSTVSTTVQEKEKSSPRPIFAYLAILLAITTPLLQLALRPVFELFPFPVDRFASLWIFWIVAAVVLFYSVKIERIPLATFGITKNTRSLRYRLIEIIVALLAGLLLAIVVVLFSGFVRGLLNAPLQNSLNPEKIIPFWVSLPGWITGAFVEELLFRSYAIERLGLLTGKRWLAAVLSAVPFVLLHLLGWDWIHVATIVLPSTIIITVIYLWRRSLLFVVIMHAVVNIPVLFLPFIARYL